MARLAGIVVPGIPHHVTQRGNVQQRTFFGAMDEPRRAAAMRRGPRNPVRARPTALRGHRRRPRP